jgi:hypothetical protein
VSAPAASLARYQAAAQQLSDFSALKALHYDPGQQQFLDWGLHTEAARLVKRTLTRPDGSPEVWRHTGPGGPRVLHRRARSKGGGGRRVSAGMLYSCWCSTPLLVL